MEEIIPRINPPQMTNTHCLNCGEELAGKFCSGCGQKADTRRISFKNILVNDVLHGVFNIERGILFTARQALLRPGKAALEFIAGRRKQHYNVFVLILLTIGVMLFTRHVDQLFAGQGAELIPDKVYLNEASKKIDDIFSQKSKIILLLFVPLAALNSLILFRRKKLNYSEHIILSGMILLGILLINVFGNLVFILNMLLQMSATLLSLLITATIAIYIGYAYVNAFRDLYTKWGIAYRIVLFYALICLEAAILVLLLVGYVTDWKYDTAVNISPFG